VTTTAKQLTRFVADELVQFADQGADEEALVKDELLRRARMKAVQLAARQAKGQPRNVLDPKLFRKKEAA
jgi:hypothetical protein